MLTQDELKDLLYYCPETGTFTRRKVNHNKYKVGEKVGTRHEQGYIVITINKKQYKAHQLACLYMLGYMPELIDHKDTIKHNNFWTNIRIASCSYNQWNKGKQINNTSGIKGLTHEKRYGGSYYGCVTKNKVAYRTKYYKAKEDAIEALQKLRESLHLEYTNHG